MGIISVHWQVFQSLIDGLLLGDGSIEPSPNRSKGRFALVQALRRREWADQVACSITEAGYPTHTGLWKPAKTVIRGRLCNRTGAVSVRTRRHSYFGDQYARWYPGGGKKQVPRDLVLDNTVLANWYFGDGGVGCKGYHARFCTDGFPPDDVAWLASQLTKRFGWSPVIERGRNRILICKTPDRADLVERITGETPDCFAYKLKLKLVDRRLLVFGELEDELRCLRTQGLTYGRMADKLGLSKSGVYSACQRLSI